MNLMLAFNEILVEYNRLIISCQIEFKIQNLNLK